MIINICSTEQWRPVVEFPNEYEVSDHGRIRRIGRNRGAKIGRILKTFIERNGYVYVQLGIDRRSYRRTVHRLVAMSFLGDPPVGCEVNHKDRVRANNHVDNLEWLSRSTNRASNPNGGPSLRGSANKSAKLTEADVIAIRALMGTMLQREIAELFGIHQTLVSLIFLRKAWSHVP